jgi:hypothetical protein
MLDTFQGLVREQAIAEVVRDATRMQKPSLTLDSLAEWVDLVDGLRKIAYDYEPWSYVCAIDVLYAIPLASVSSSREHWLENHLNKWKDFYRTEPHGEHYTMIGSEYLYSSRRS